jgi:hypothetical protein
MARLAVILPVDCGPHFTFSYRAAPAPVLASAIWEEKMRKLTTAAIGAACLMLGAGGATLYTYAATGPAVYSVYEADVKDVAAYTAALPEVDKLIKENNGHRVAGGFDKTKTISGSPAGNRYVILKWDDMASFEKSYNGGVKAWIEKNGPGARQVVVESVEPK